MGRGQRCSSIGKLKIFGKALDEYIPPLIFKTETRATDVGMIVVGAVYHMLKMLYQQVE